MKQFNFPTIKLILIIFVITLTTGCCKLFTAEGHEDFFGTATINNENYKNSRIWHLFYTSEGPKFNVRTYYKCFDFHPDLDPEQSDLPNYTISFYVVLDDDNINVGHSYQLGHYKKFDITNFYPDEKILTYFSENKSLIIPENKDGIAFAIMDDSKTPISLEGEIVIDKIHTDPVLTMTLVQVTTL